MLAQNHTQKFALDAALAHGHLKEFALDPPLARGVTPHAPCWCMAAPKWCVHQSGAPQNGACTKVVRPGAVLRVYPIRESPYVVFLHQGLTRPPKLWYNFGAISF